MDELEKLRDAHTVLISMIKNHHIDIEEDHPVQIQTTNAPRLSDFIMCGRGEKNLLDSSRASID